MSVAIYYHPDGFETGRTKLMGRHAAGEEFLKAFIRYGGQKDLHCYASDEKHFKHFTDKVKEYTPNNNQCFWIPWTHWPKLADAGCLFMPGPVLGELAWVRRHVNNRAFSLCGITHTTATHAVMDAIGDFLTAPMAPWDALICTSNSVKQMVQQVIDEQAEYLKQRLNCATTPKANLQLPVIPLGVDCDTYAASEEVRLQSRKHWRKLLSISDESFVVLYMGRFSFHAKAHPMPIFRSLEETAKRTSKPITLIMSGWFENDAIKEQFLKGAQVFCPSVKITFVDGRKPEVRKTIWFAADVFTSPSDNVQETFGLTPVEAMAAGLPVVATDWDGYRETVRHGLDGFLIPTWMPPSGSMGDLALNNAIGIVNYDHYIGYQSQFTCVDIEASTKAYLALIENADLRKRMGHSGQQWARINFDWKVIIAQYESLWAELDRLRTATAEPSYAVQPGRAPMPLRQDPTILFSSYPTHSVTPETIVSPNSLTAIEQFKIVKAFLMNNFVAGNVAVESEIVGILTMLTGKGPQTVKTLYALAPANRRKALLMTIMWLAKMGLVDLNLPVPDEQAYAAVLAPVHV